MERSRLRHEQEGGISTEEMRRMLGLPLRIDIHAHAVPEDAMRQRLGGEERLCISA